MVIIFLLQFLLAQIRNLRLPIKRTVLVFIPGDRLQTKDQTLCLQQKTKPFSNSWAHPLLGSFINTSSGSTATKQPTKRTVYLARFVTQKPALLDYKMIRHMKPTPTTSEQTIPVFFPTGVFAIFSSSLKVVRSPPQQITDDSTQWDTEQRGNKCAWFSAAAEMNGACLGFWFRPQD